MPNKTINVNFGLRLLFKSSMKLTQNYILLLFFWLFMSQMFVSCSAQQSMPKDSIEADIYNHKKVVKVVRKKATASYYADNLHGRRTASGKPLDNNKQTCAHRTLPFGTILKVTNLKNQKWVEVVVTDRGPHKKSREIDLTKKAFMEIADNKRSGEISVKIEILEPIE